MGSCYIEGEPSDLWRECAIIDVSALGLGIELLHPDPVDLLGLWQDGELRTHVSRRITVRLELGPSVEMTVAGRVRNAGSGPDGIVRAGVEFVGLTETERSMVDRLVQLVSANTVDGFGPQQTIADSVPVLCEAPESLVEGRARHKVPDPVPLYDDLPASLVAALGGREMADVHPVTWEPPENLIEARAGRRIPDPVPVLDDDDLSESLVEALGQREIDDPPETWEPSESLIEARAGRRIPDPVPVLDDDDLPESLVEALGQREIDDPPETWEPSESLIEARGRHRIVEALGQQETEDPVPGLSELSESFVEFLERQQEIDDQVPVLSEGPESLVEALGQSEIDEQVPVLSVLPESLVEALVQQETIADPDPGIRDLARKSGELAFLTLRVISSDVLGVVGRLPVAPRLLNVAGRHARLGFGETRHAGEQRVTLTTVKPEESEDPLFEEGF
jgi:hypothetical protein